MNDRNHHHTYDSANLGSNRVPPDRQFVRQRLLAMILRNESQRRQDNLRNIARFHKT